MALYVLAPVLLLGIPFLLYCLWNFSRELKPRSTRVFVASKWPTWGSVHATPMSLSFYQAHLCRDLPRRTWLAVPY